MNGHTSKWLVAKVRCYSQFIIKRNYEVYFNSLIKVNEIFFPYYIIGKKVIIPLSDYIFVNITDEEIKRIPEWVKFEPNMKYFLYNSSRNLAVIPDSEMESFKKKSQEYIRIKHIKDPELVVGKVAYIKSGIFAGLLGEIRAVKSNTVKLYVNSFRCIIEVKKEDLDIYE